MAWARSGRRVVGLPGAPAADQAVHRKAAAHPLQANRAATVPSRPREVRAEGHSKCSQT
jgi:hypothetical protein